ncbi:MAG: putative toxin-antitoxin system toxin component, PIN family [Phycisphaerae bacterium]|nr:putative toxin-antitoxin system toxin component, PIN family [Phycisphaerae bacterium]
MSGPSVVLDSNVIISGLAFVGSPSKCLDLVIQGNVDLICCRYILDEVGEKLVGKLGFPDDRAAWAVRKVESLARMVEPVGPLRCVCRDPKDDPIIACAPQAKTDYLVTGDKDLLVIETYEKVRIITLKNLIDLTATT